MTADIHTLTGAYALDALTDPERAAFERHLELCSGCAQEVHELRVTAAQLGLATAIQPPEELKQRVMTAITTTRQLPPEVPEPAAPAQVIPLRARRWPLRAALAAAAAAVVVAGTFGVQAYDARNQLQQAQSEVAGITSVLGANDARTASAAGLTGGTGTVVLARSQNKAVFMAAGLPGVPADRTYQVWVIGSQGPVSAGLLQAGSDNRMRPIIADGLNNADKIGVTVEPAGGSKQPTTQPVMLLKLA